MSAAENKAVFLSYASQDADAARRICEALRAAGVEVWFDQNELVGGDAWDAKIRKQIKECALFVPVISVATQARPEGYFRLEWKLAADRSHLIVRDHPFLLPVVVDATPNATARVPEDFHAVQWTRLSDPASHVGFAVRVKSILVHGGRESMSATIPGTRFGPPATARRSKKLVGVIAAALLGGAAIALWQTTRTATPESAANPSSVISNSKSTTSPMSEARQTAERALTLMTAFKDGRLSDGKAKLEAADRLLERAVAMEPADGEIWGIWAQLDAIFVQTAGGAVQGRRDSAWKKARQAISFSPEAFHARLGLAAALVASGDQAKIGEAESQLRRLLEEHPDNPKVVDVLDLALRRLKRHSEADALLARAAPGDIVGARSPRIWQSYLNGQYPDAELALERLLAEVPSADTGGFTMLRIRLCFEWHGDLDRAKALLEKAPADFATTDEGAFTAMTVFLWRREPQQALVALKAVPKDWLETRYYTGPKAFWVGQCYLADQRPDAARNAFKVALKVLEEHLTTDPENTKYLRWKALTLEHLNEPAAATDIWRLRDQLAGGTPRARSPEERVAELETALANPKTSLTVAKLRLDPFYDELRAYPKFQALLAQMETNPRFTPTPKPTSLPSAIAPAR